MNACLISVAFVFVSHSLFCQHEFLGGLFFFSNFYFIHFLYLFLAVLGLHCCMGFSLVVESGGCSPWTSHCSGFSGCRAWTLGYVGFSSCSMWA